MDHRNINSLEKASRSTRLDVMRIGLALLFITGIVLYTLSRGEASITLVAAAVIGAYMAMNIGANDVANNVGPAVGSKALTMTGALIIAAIFEAGGALIAGGDVVSTIRSGIINPAGIPDPDTFIWLMMAALLAAALWLNIATAVGAPVSTTHSIVGAVLGAGIAAAGPEIANWGKMGAIAASWVISPVLGGLVAAGFLFLIKRCITYKEDMAAAAGRTVPMLIAAMTWTFSTYIILKGLNQIWKVGFLSAALIGGVLAIAAYFISKPYIMRKALARPNTKQGVNEFFTLPLIFAAALLSFAHGSNDVANAIGPLAAIVDALSHHAGIAKSAAIPLWVMMIGALGIVVGLCLFGPKVIRTVGSEITELDQMRAYCIAMSATLTVIIASQMGLPVSSTHIAVGGVFGVGFLREYIKNRYARMVAEIKDHHPEDDQPAIDAFLKEFEIASVRDKDSMLKDLKVRAKQQLDPAHFSKLERKGLRKVYKQELVKRSQIMRIAAAWIITVPASALIAALVFYIILGIQA